MNELIRINKLIIGNGEVNSVDARELHQFLDVKTRFNDWIERRIKEYGFVINTNYSILSTPVSMAAYRHDYFLSLEMAKELSMVERNERGKEARKYFIECENRLKSFLPQSFSEALQLAADQARIIEAQKPKIEFVNNYVDATGIFTLTATAKKLKIKRKDLIECLMRDRAIFRRGKRIEPYADKVEKGYFEIKSGEKEGYGFDQMYLTTKGIQWVAESYMTELAG